MDYNDFNKYVYWLGKCIPQNMQEEAMKELCNCDEKYVKYIIDINNAHTWENALKVICKIGYPKNRTAMSAILYLFQDINWKTTEQAIKLVEDIYLHEPQMVLQAIDDATKTAANDDDWLFGLECLRRKLEKEDKRQLV